MLKKNSAGTKPWLAWRMLAVCSIMLVTTYWTDGEDTVLRWTIVVGYFVAAWTCMLKERVPYGPGDLLAVYELWFILALSVIADVIDTHPYSFLSVFSVLAAGVMLRQVHKNAHLRFRSVEPF